MLKYLYDVIDIVDNRKVCENVRAGTVAQAIGISSNWVCTYAQMEIIWNKRYKIIRFEMEGEKERLMDEWDRVTALLRKFPEITKRIYIACEEP